MKKLLLLLVVLAVSGIFLCYTDTESIKDKQCTRENVYMEIKKAGIAHADVVFAQIMLESANLKSRLTKTNNNFLGMKFPERRQTTAVGQFHGYAKYLGWQDCVQDYLLYQKHMLKNRALTKKQYIAFIGKKYSECGSYRKRIMRVMKQNSEFVRTQDSLYSASTI
jgi:uncharacterized FlgJ-related protein